MKRNDLILIGILLVLGLGLFFGMRLYENLSSTGNVYAKVYYQDTLILMIDLNSDEYTVFDTEYASFVDVGRASEGIFYVPGTVTTDMSALYAVDPYAETNQIVGIKLQVSEGKISVVYQESPLDICELQNPTDSSLHPLVCLPNELVINIVTNLSSDEFVPDAILE